MSSRTSIRVDIETANQHSIIQQLQAQIHTLAARVNELERNRLDDLRQKIEDLERQGERDWKLCSDIHDRLDAATCQADRDYLAECLEGPYQAWQKNMEEYREAIEAMVRQKEIVRAGERQQAGAAVRDHH